MKYVLTCILIAFCGPVLASDDHTTALGVFEQNKILPLSEIVPEIEAQLGARLLEVEFEREHGQYVYELELITETGRMIEVLVDATTGLILEFEQEDWSEDHD